jgi:hypothetical protein
MMEATVSCPVGAILDSWAERAWTDGLQLEHLADLESLSIRTCNNTYDITVLCGRTGDVLVRGGAFFPTYTPARLAGASLGGSFLKLRGIYVGFSMELHVERSAIVTSRVQSIGVGPEADGSAAVRLH